MPTFRALLISRNAVLLLVPLGVNAGQPRASRIRAVTSVIVASLAGIGREQLRDVTAVVPQLAERPCHLARPRQRARVREPLQVFCWVVSPPDHADHLPQPRGTEPPEVSIG